jgi:hypothetical protein
LVLYVNSPEKFAFYFIADSNLGFMASSPLASGLGAVLAQMLVQQTPTRLLNKLLKKRLKKGMTLMSFRKRSNPRLKPRIIS